MYTARDASKVAVNTAGPYIAHLESQYSWAQARTLPHSKGSRPTGMEAPHCFATQQPPTYITVTKVAEGSYHLSGQLSGKSTVMDGIYTGHTRREYANLGL